MPEGDRGRAIVRFVQDDAFITYRYARNLARGEGLVFIALPPDPLDDAAPKTTRADLMGIARAFDAGFDACHFNLHKTFSSPHGCEGPAAGAAGIQRELNARLAELTSAFGRTSLAGSNAAAVAVQQVIRESGHEEVLSSGIVLSGGAAVMQGMVELGEEVFHMPVRIGHPRYDGPLSEVVCEPRYATAMGLVMEGAVQRRRGLQARETRSVKQVFGRMKAWFERNF